MRSRPLLLSSLLLGAALAARSSSARATACDPTITDDDSAIHITTPAQLTSTRTALVRNIFNATTLPNPTVPGASIHLNVTPSTVPVGLRNELTNLLAQLSNVGRVDMIEYPMKNASGTLQFTSLGWHIIPSSGKKNKLVVVHQGHSTTIVDSSVGADEGGGGGGISRTIKNLVFEGYSVLAMYMPGFRPDDAGAPSHSTLMNTAPLGGGSGTRFFMEPVRAFVRYLQTNSAAGNFPAYTDFFMTGLSGGGWTTTVYSAIDPTIEMSFPVAGSIPLYLRCPSPGSSTYNHDAEQFQGHGIYSIAGYQDLYILGATGLTSSGFPRHQTQVLNRQDSCCFGQSQHFAAGPWDSDVNAYELAVRNQVWQLGQGGMFRVEIDENTTTADGIRHMISTGAIFRTILGELNDARRVIGRQIGNAPGNDNDAFYRGVNGHLWHRAISAGIEEDTNLPIVGASDSAFLAGNSAPVFNVITRNLQSAPILVSTHGSTGGWFFRTFSGTMNNDPTIVPGLGNSDWWIYAIGTDYLPYVWDKTGNFVRVSTTPALGPISAGLRSFEAGFHAYYLAWDRSVHHAFRSSPTASWQDESLGGVTFGFPVGTVDPSSGNLVVFQLGTDGMLYWNRKTAGDQNPGNSWTGWQSISSAAGATGTVLTGTPSFSGAGSTWTVFVPTNSSKQLAMFKSSSSGVWTFTNLGGNWTSAPTATGAGVFVEGRPSGLWRWLANALTNFGGVFD